MCTQKELNERLRFDRVSDTASFELKVGREKVFCSSGVSLSEEAKASHTLTKVMQTLVRPDLLIIDELGFVPFSENGARLLFDVFASRYEKGSIAVSTNLSFEKWDQIFGSTELTAALIDRFTHRCHIFSYEGRSARLMEAKERRKIKK